MTAVKSGLKKLIPDAWVPGIASAYDGLRRLPELPAAYLHPWRRESMRHLAAMKDIHKGERCFIIGNGPSLKETDLSLLKNEKTMGMNRIYMLFDELGFKTTYLLSINDLVIEQCAGDFLALDVPRFFAWRSRQWLRPQPDLHFLYTSYTGPGFSTDITRRLWEGATVTNIALQVAYYLGFTEVILIGVDHSFVSQGKPNTTVVSTGDDPNHFSGAYFGKGFRWQLPDLETSEIGYRMAREAYEKAGRRVLDATIGGKLQIFDKAEYKRLF